MQIEFLKKYELFNNEKLKKLTLLKNQGFSNINYLLQTSKKNYLIREFKSLHVNRKLEFEVAYKAYQRGIGAKPLLLDEENSLMICDFLEGHHKKKLSYKDIVNMAKLIKKMHKIKILKYQKSLVLCHHDLNPKNFIFSKNIKLIDWEYAYLDDKYFDLASIIVEFKLNPKEEKLFLNSYFQKTYKRKKIYSFKIKYIKICIAWFKKQNNLKEKLKFKKRLNECNRG